MKKRKPVNSRDAAAQLVLQWMNEGHFIDVLLGDIADDRAFVMEMAYGVAKRRRTLEWLIARCMPRRPEQDVQAYLMVGLYQLLYMDDVPDHAAVNETVTAATAHIPPGASKAVNAVLRRFTREREPFAAALAGQPVAIRHSHPDELVRRWTAQFGPVAAEELCVWNNSRPQVVIRLNAIRTTMAEFQQKLTEAGVTAEPDTFRPQACLVLPRGSRVEKLPGYAEGLFTVQDSSTLAAVEWLDPQPGESILDACAAPGGKTAMIAERLRGQGRLVAVDVQAARCRRLEENLRRLQFGAVECVCADMRDTHQHNAANAAPFDRILLDVPCSNTGVLRRRPDARWRFTADKLTELGLLQTALLDASAKRLRSGGVLVYSTCSLEPEENGRAVAAWLASRPDFRLERDQLLFPPATGCDGAYMARLTGPV